MAIELNLESSIINIYLTDDSIYVLTWSTDNSIYEQNMNKTSHLFVPNFIEILEIKI